jgi:hypothetical protein
VSGEREVIPAGRQPAPGYRHLLPIARLLIEDRGHMAIDRPEKFGFRQELDGYECHLTRSITAEDWAAVNERFVLPENVVYIFGLIRDQVNNIDMVGHDEMFERDGAVSIEEWEARLRAKRGG